MLEGYLFNFHCDTQLSDYIVVVTIAEYLRFSDGRRAGLMVSLDMLMSRG
jgi:hypothetical protein